MAPKKKGAKEKGKRQGKGAKSGKQSHVLAYGDDTYWNDRYTANPIVFDWYQKYEGVKAFINMYIPKATRVLVIGCGNSTMSEEMVHDGYIEVVNIDISSVVLEFMVAKYKGVKEMAFSRMDVREMKNLKELTIDHVIDKGLFDSFMCGIDAPTNVQLMLTEVRRVMKPKGVYILITYGDPRVRLPYLKTTEFQWEITLYVIPRPSSTKAIEPSSRIFTDPVYVCEDNTLGPQFNLDDFDWHYVYVCTKELPGTKELPTKKGDAKGKGKKK
ncbi:unnamed protein product [Sphagnum balticum]